MQNSVTPGYRRTLLCLSAAFRSFVSILSIFFFAGFVNSANAVPPGVPDFTNPNTRLVILTDNVKANGDESAVVRAYVYDNLNNPVVGVTVFFTTVPGNVTYPVVTNSLGIADFAFNNFTVGTVVVDGRIGSTHFNPTVSPQFVAYLADQNQSTLTVTATNAFADNVATNSVRATVKDAAGNPVPNETVDFQITSGTGAFVGSASVTTDANGVANISLTSGTPGDVSISATVVAPPEADVTINAIATVHFKDHSPSPANPNTRLETTATNAIANGSAANTVRAVIVDADGVPVANQTIDFAFATNTIGATFTSATTVMTDASGIASISMVSTAAGTVTITADVNGTPIVNGSPASVTFIPGPPDLTNPLTALTITANNAEADDVAINTVRAHVVDQYNNPVPNQTIVFSFTGTATPVGSLTVTTDASGNALLSLHSMSIGSCDVTATLSGNPITFGSPATVNFVEGSPDVTVNTTLLEVTANYAVADNIATNSVKATITDKTGHPLANQSVTFSLTSGVATFVGATTVMTDVNGVATIDLVSTVAGQLTVAAAVNATPLDNGSPADLGFVPGPPDLNNPLTAIVIDVDNSEASGLDSNVVHVHLADQYGNAVPNELIVFSFGGDAATNDPLTGSTDGSGDLILKLASTTVGLVDVSATYGGTPLINGNPSTVHFVEGAPDVDVTTTKLEVVTDHSVADNIATNSVKAAITDKTGHPLANQSVTFNIASGTATFVGSATVMTDVNGVATIDLVSTVAGPLTVTATVNATPLKNGSPASLDFVPGPPDLSNPLTAIVIDVDNREADGLDSNVVHVHLADQYGNAVPNESIVFSFVGAAATNNPLTGNTDASGNLTLKLASTTVGTVDVSATYNANPLVNGNPSTVTFVEGTPNVDVSTTKLEVVTNHAVADNIATNSVKATITDKTGHPLANQSVTFALASGTATFVGSVTIMTDANGVATIDLISTVAGPLTVTAAVNATALKNGSPAALDFVAGPPDLTNPLTSIVVDIPTAIANGLDSTAVHAHIVDQYNNPVPLATIVFNYTGTAATNSPLTVTTDGAGNAQLKLASTTIGTSDISATVNGTPMINGNPATVNFIAGKPDVVVPTTRLQLLTTDAIADSVATNSLKATITDATGHLLAGEMVIFKIFSGAGSFIGSDTVYTDVNGEAAISLVSTVADSVYVTATVKVNTTDVAIINGSAVGMKFIAGPPDLNNPLTTIVVDTDNAPANGQSKNIVRVHIVDKYGNPVEGQTIDFSYNGQATASGPLTVTTDEYGNAVMELTSEIPGTVSVSANLNGTPLIHGNPSAVHFIIYADVSNPATHLSVFTDNAFADGIATNSVRAHVVDNTGQPMPGVTIVFTLASGDATFTTSQSAVTNASGDAYILLNSTKVGYVTITATADGNPIVFGSPARVRFTTVDVWVPKVFSPNGDGVNDLVRPIANGIQLQYFRIYNRWGNLLFATNDINKGWDGKFKGVVQPNETYLWILEGRDITTNEKVVKRGMITLVK